MISGSHSQVTPVSFSGYYNSLCVPTTTQLVLVLVTLASANEICEFLSKTTVSKDHELYLLGGYHKDVNLENGRNGAEM